jgi:hypothetical protein
MPGLSHCSWSLRFVSLFAVVVSSVAVAQSQSPSRITQVVDEANLTLLKGNTYPLARPEFDRGPAPPSLPMERMLLVLTRSPEQKASLAALLDQQQDKSSPNYHKWLTPEQFGQQFGPADQDLQTITAWLRRHGFQVARVSKGRTVIEFSGTVAEVQEALHTSVHRYTVMGKDHWANASDPQIPTALLPVVAGIDTLHNFPRKPMHRIVGVFSRDKSTGRYQRVPSVPLENPLITFAGNCGLEEVTCYALTPYDFATIYNVLPLWTAGTDGTGQSIAIVGQSDIYPQDVSDFRSGFGLPPANLNIIQDGPDPGKLWTEGDEAESDLDVEWAGAVAKGATIDFVVSGSTNSSAGVDLSAEYIVDNNLAPVMSESYGACELDMGTAGNQFYNQLWQQAAAQGITVFVATGDSGSAVCDRYSESATQGLSVNGVSSTPYDVAVGGTDFNDLQDPTTYWNSTNNQTTQASAKGYIPEMTWNDSCTNQEVTTFLGLGMATAEATCNNTNAQNDGFLNVVGGSGGMSNCTISDGQNESSCSGGYAKPSWQAGAGVPTDGKRDVPDVSLFASDGLLNASFYVICETDGNGGCSDGSNFVGIGGTSASAPTFAGIMAMVNQKMQSRQGDADYVLYALAAKPGASCTSSGTVASSCIFYDVTTGTNAMPCVTGSPNCVTNTSGDQDGVLSGYGATTGYDLASGLGSVNAEELVNNWGTVTFAPSTTSLTLNGNSAVSITHGSPVSVDVTVKPQSGTGTPTGLVSVLTSNQQEVTNLTLSNGVVSTSTDLLPGGSYTVTAHYNGDGTFAASDSSPGIAVTVQPEPSTTTTQVFSLDQNGVSIPFAAGPYGGTVVFLRANVAGQSGQGAATGTVNLTDTFNGTTTNLAGNPYPLNSEGYTMTPLPLWASYAFPAPGTHSIVASYSGDPSFNPSISPAVSFTIAPAQTSTATSVQQCPLASGQCTLLLGSLATIFATVSRNGSPFANGPTGTVTFYSNGVQLGPPSALDPSIIPAIASFGTTQLPQGQNNLTAQYSGDMNYAASTSSATSLDLVVGTSLGLTTSSSSIQQGQSVTFTAQVTPGHSGGPTPTGTVQFSSNGTNIGIPVALSNGLAQTTTSTLAGGSDQIAATYSGDANYLSSSSSLTETVNLLSPLTISVNPATITISRPGGSGSTVLTFTAHNAFAGTISLTPSLCSGLPSESSCNFNPSSITLSATTTTATSTLAILTTAPSVALPRIFNPPGGIGWKTLGIAIALALLCLLGVRTPRWRWSAVLGALLLAILLTNDGCGGGGGGGQLTNTGTPMGSYNITVTVSSGGIQATSSVSVEVN